MSRDQDHRHRPAYFSIEAVFALAIFGLSLSGLAATTVNQLRLMESVERRVLLLAPPGTGIAVGFETDPGNGGVDPTFSIIGADPTLENRARRWSSRLIWPRLGSHDVRPRRGASSGPFPIEVPMRAAIQPDLSWSGIPSITAMNLAITSLDPASGSVHLMVQDAD